MLNRGFFTLIFLLCVALTTPLVARADDPVPAPVPAPKSATFESAFQSGLEAFQKQDYAAAQAAFDQALSLHPDETSTLFNLALSHARQNHTGWALALLRRVLVLDPTHSEARQALRFLMKKSPPHDIPHQIETWESLHNELLSGVPLPTLAFFSLFLFFVTGWTWFSFFGARRRALQSESALPSTPLPAVGFAFLFVVATFLTVAKKIDERDTRATIVNDKVAALSAPREQAPSLFELFEGLEVLVRQTQGDWIQVTYPGAMTGWIPKNTLFITQAGVLP